MWQRARSALCFVFPLVAASHGLAQEPATRAEIERQRETALVDQRAALISSLRTDLAGDDPVRIAWAAHDAGRWHLNELAPAIVAALLQSPKRDLGPLESAQPGTTYLDLDPEEKGVEHHATRDPKLLDRFVPAVLLDALVELDATAPPEFIEQLLLEFSTRAANRTNPFSFFRGAREPALVLFAKHASELPHVVDRVLDLTTEGTLAPTTTLAWIATSFCVANDPRKLAEKWITLPHWQVTIHVRGGGRLPLGMCGGVLRFWRIAWPDPLPPPAIDLFSAVPEVGALCLVEKPLPLFWRHSSSQRMDASPERFAGEPDEVSSNPGDNFVITMLRAAGEVTSDRPVVPLQQSFEFDWRDNDSLLAFARTRRSEIEACWKEVVAALIYHYRIDGPLPDRYPPRITIDFIDERSAALRRSDPLPDPP